MRTAIYTRVSTSVQDYERQISELKEYCRIHNHEIKYIFAEKISGAVDDRPEFTKLCALTREDIDCVIVLELSRLGRRMSTIIKTIEEFNQKQICVIALKEKLVTLDEQGNITPSTIMLLSVTSAVSEIERSTIRERTLSGRKHKILSGEISYAGAAPYGYVKEGKKFAVDAVAAEKIRTVYDLCLNGNSIDQISVIMGLGRSLVSKILKNEAYTGSKFSKITGSVVSTPVIVSKAVFDKAQQKLKDNKLDTKKSVFSHPLKGKIHCGECGHILSKHGEKWACHCNRTTISFKTIQFATETALRQAEIVFGYKDTREKKKAVKMDLLKKAADMSEITDNLYDRIEEEKKKLEVLKDVFSVDQLKNEVSSIKALEKEAEKNDKILQGIFEQISVIEKNLECDTIDMSVIDSVWIRKIDRNNKILEFHILGDVIKLHMNNRNRNKMAELTII